jgi:hypothetical protein
MRLSCGAASVRTDRSIHSANLDHAKIIDLHKKGNGATAIAKAIGCSCGAVFKVLDLNGK